MNEDTAMHMIPTREFAARDLGRLADMCESITTWLPETRNNAMTEDDAKVIKDLQRAIGTTRRLAQQLARNLHTPALWNWPDEPAT